MELTVNQLKNAIWQHNNGMVPVGGMPIEWYRTELYKLTGETKGYHEEDETAAAANNQPVELKPVECIEKLETVLSLMYEIEGALIFHCFPDRDVFEGCITDEEKHSWPSLAKSVKAQGILRDMLCELRGY